LIYNLNIDPSAIIYIPALPKLIKYKFFDRTEPVTHFLEAPKITNI